MYTYIYMCVCVCVCVWNRNGVFVCILVVILHPNHFALIMQDSLSTSTAECLNHEDTGIQSAQGDLSLVRGKLICFLLWLMFLNMKLSIN